MKWLWIFGGLVFLTGMATGTGPTILAGSGIMFFLMAMVLSEIKDMEGKMQDGYTKCVHKARYRFTWAGEDERVVCELHAGQIKGLGEAMGYPVQFIPLTAIELMKEPMCTQPLKKEEGS